MIGQTISHYKITEKLGEGGMGVVYKAEDTKLKRPVALKFLSPHLLSDTEAKERFIREAQAAAALNHPNICTVHEIDEAGGRTFIVMAFLEGASLDTKIEAGPLKLDEALDFAIQTVQGLQAAHGKKIVHRDIKPANLMVTPQGAKQLVTIMDFGLAQLADRSKLTQGPTALGTISYMSPEQAQGVELDHRTDLWALGAVIYEMVTGQRAFQGHYDQAITYSIQHEEPEPMTALRTGVPMELERITGKCLVKDREKRYQSIADLLLDLETLREKQKSSTSAIVKSQRSSQGVAPQAANPTQDLEEHPLAKYRVIENLEEQDDSVLYRAEDTQTNRSVAIRILPESSTQNAQTRERRRHLLSRAVSLLAIGLAAAVAFLLLNPSAREAPLRRFSFTPDNLSAGDGNLAGAHVAISPDGKRIVYVAGAGETKLWVRELDQAHARELAGTAEARGPFWSPDSQFIGFATETDVRKISVRGGTPMTLCELPHWAFGGGSWSPDEDSIVFSSGYPLRLFQVPARGGTPEILFDPEESMGPHIWAPHFFHGAGARGITFGAGAMGAPKIAVRDPRDHRNEVLAEGSWPFYSGGGHLLFERGDDLWALPFSAASLQATGEAFPVAQNAQGASVARDGTLVYTDAQKADQQLVWRSRTGEKLEAIGRPHIMARPSLSPDGRQVVVVSGGREEPSIWVYDIARGSRTRITFNPLGAFQPIWTPSGEQITYSAFQGRFTDIFSSSADGSGGETQLTDGPLSEYDPHWSPDGKYLIYHTLGDSKTQRDLWYQQIEPGGGTSDPVVFGQTLFNERNGRFSPNGRFVAYCSDRSGQYEVYVRPFPNGGRVAKVSVNGGGQPRWGKNGKELFYVEGTTLMSVSVRGRGAFSADLPKPLFDSAGLRARIDLNPNYDVSGDGQRILLVEPAGDEPGKPRSIHVVQNWFAEFKDRE